MHTSVSRDLLTFTFGKPLQQIMQELGGPQAEPLRQAFVDYTLAHEDQIALFPGAEEALRQLKALGIGTALVTSRLYRGAKRDLDLFQLADYFDVFVTPESTQYHKPHPEPAQKALAALQLAPEQAIFVGDSGHDLQCGKAAGCKTAVVRYSLFNTEELLLHKPDYLLDCSVGSGAYCERTRLALRVICLITVHRFHRVPNTEISCCSFCYRHHTKKGLSQSA